jgi:CrcB protein
MQVFFCTAPAFEPHSRGRRFGVIAWGSLLAVGGGAAAGAWLRWWLGIVLNPVFPTLPLGTVAANLLGGLLMGIAMEILTRHASLPAEARLALTTGFLGGLTTFSTFSAEIVSLLLRRELLWSAIGVGVHVIGSVAMTLLGLFAARALFAWGAS